VALPGEGTLAELWNGKSRQVLPAPSHHAMKRRLWAFAHLPGGYCYGDPGSVTVAASARRSPSPLLVRGKPVQEVDLPRDLEGAELRSAVLLELGLGGVLAWHEDDGGVGLLAVAHRAGLLNPVVRVCNMAVKNLRD